MSALYQIIAGIVHLGAGATCISTACIIKAGMPSVISANVTLSELGMESMLEFGTSTDPAGSAAMACGVILALVGVMQLAGAGCGWLLPRPKTVLEKVTVGLVTTALILLEFATSTTLVHLSGSLSLWRGHLAPLEDELEILAYTVAFLLLASTVVQICWFFSSWGSSTSTKVEKTVAGSIQNNKMSLHTLPGSIGVDDNDREKIDTVKDDEEDEEPYGNARLKLLSCLEDDHIYEDSSSKRQRAKLPISKTLKKKVDPLSRKSCSPDTTYADPTCVREEEVKAEEVTQDITPYFTAEDTTPVKSWDTSQYAVGETSARWDTVLAEAKTGPVANTQCVLEVEEDSELTNSTFLEKDLSATDRLEVEDDVFSDGPFGKCSIHVYMDLEGTEYENEKKLADVTIKQCSTSSSENINTVNQSNIFDQNNTFLEKSKSLDKISFVSESFLEQSFIV